MEINAFERVFRKNHNLPLSLDNSEKRKSYTDCFPSAPMGEKRQVGKDVDCKIDKSGIRLRDMDHPERYSDSKGRAKQLVKKPKKDNGSQK